MPRLIVAVPLALLATAALSCASLPKLPSQGGPRWLALESEHFTLYTDRPDDVARKVSAQLERRITELSQAGLPQPGPLALQVQVVLLEQRSELERYVGPDHPGLLVQELPFTPLFAVSRETYAESLRTLNHELVHFLAARAFGSHPLWLAEGLACYFESAYESDSGGFVVGEVPEQYLRWLRQHPRMSASALFEFSGPVNSLDLYASSWLLVHYLMSQRSAEFAAFRSALAQGRSLTDSWAETLPDLAPERLEGLLDGYLRAGNFLSASRSAANSSSTSASAKPHPLGDADVYALRAQLNLLCPDCGKGHNQAALENLQLALNEDATHITATALAVLISPAAAAVEQARLRALTRAHPESWQAWLLLGRAQTRSDAVARSCDDEVAPKLRELAPAQPFALMYGAVCELAAGQRRAALELSARALALQPMMPGVLLLRAAILRATGECAELAAVLTSLHNAAHTRLPGEDLRKLSECRPILHHETASLDVRRCSVQNSACGSGSITPW
jgi:tetratricopeptide (TPR) repeat protein